MCLNTNVFNTLKQILKSCEYRGIGRFNESAYFKKTTILFIEKKRGLFTFWFLKIICRNFLRPIESVLLVTILKK